MEPARSTEKNLARSTKISTDNGCTNGLKMALEKAKESPTGTGLSYFPLQTVLLFDTKILTYYRERLSFESFYSGAGLQYRILDF